MAPPYELVIFDCDGVLVDSERLAVRVDVEVLAEMGWSLSEQEVVERFVGRPHAHMTEQLSVHLGRELPEGWGAGLADRYLAAFDAELVAVPGIVAALDAIDLPWCVASSSSHRHLRHVLGLTDLYDRFAGRIFSAAEDVPRGKPAPDVFLHAAEQMGVAPQRCVVVEDSVAGVEAAIAAGMDVYAYCGGVTPRERLDCGAKLFDHMHELPLLLGSR